MIISVIVAVAENNVIGKDNKLIWHLPEDLKYFKKLTMGCPIIMGRKTYESIGRPLPGRLSIIVTRNKDFSAEGCVVVHTLQSAVEFAKNYNEIFIIGGAQLYSEAIHLADRIYYTKVHHSFEGDVYFPSIDKNLWVLSERIDMKADEKNKYDYSFLTYNRIKK